jgi:GDP-4-dehydro-6-deoxy-D-mannose reductase
VAGLPLVTGATGFAGGHLLDDLVEEVEAHDPTAPDAPAVAAWANPRGAPVIAPDPRVAWNAVDLLDRVAVRDAIATLRPSIIFHLAGAADVGTSWADPVTPLKVNSLGTHHLLDAVRLAGLDTAVVLAGSATVYRASSDPIGEDSPIGPSSPYGVSKLAQEMLAGQVTSFPVFVARPFNHAGPRQSSAYVTSSFARQIAEIEAGVAAPVLSVGNLDARRDITDVRDTVRAYRLLAERGQPGRPYNICSGRAYRIGDLLQILLAHARTAIHVASDPARLRPSDHPLLLGDPSRVRDELGWQPTIAIEDTLKDLLDDWRRRVAVARA